MAPVVPAIVARASAHGTRTAIFDRNGRYTYDQLCAAAAAVAARLLDGRSDLDEARVGFLVTPGFEYVAVQWGIWLAGGIAVPLPLSHPPAELAYLIQDSEASIVVADAENQAAIEPLANSAGARFYTSANLTNLTNPRTDEPTNLTNPTNFTNPTNPTNRPALIVYTSGTTGRPKGVVTTHANLTAQIESLVTAWEWTASDRTLLVLPLHHVHGILNIVSCALWSGAVLEMAPRFESESTWERLSSGELTLFSAVPTVYHRLIGSWDGAPADVRESRSRGCHALRLMMSGSAALPRIVLDRWKEISGHVLLERYGMTEVGMALSNPLHGNRRPGYVGQPLPGVSACIVDGELQLKGPGVFSEYWRQPDATREAFVDGWFRTGDAAVVEDGALSPARTRERRHPQIRRTQDLRPRNRGGAAHASRHCRVRRRRRGRRGVGSARLLRGRTAAGRETRSRGVETMGQNTSGPVQNSAEPCVRVAAAAKRHGQGRQA